jgi:hypothetical protein
LTGSTIIGTDPTVSWVALVEDLSLLSSPSVAGLSSPSSFLFLAEVFSLALRLTGLGAATLVAAAAAALGAPELTPFAFRSLSYRLALVCG